MSLAKAAAKSGIWFASFKTAGQVFTWLVTVAVARILTPRDYGLMALASILTGYIEVFSEMGLGAAIVQREKISQDEYSSNFWFSMFLGLLFAVACLFLAFPTAWIFNEPKVVPITQLISVLFIIGSAMVVPFNILTRNLRFKAIGMIQLIAVVISSCFMLWMAYHGYGVWTLVLGTIIQRTASVVLVFVVSGWRPDIHFKFHEVRPFLRFGLNIAGAKSLFYVFQKADVFVVGKVLGTQAVGSYFFAKLLSSLPNDKLNSIINQISFPLFSRFQNDLVKVRDLYLRTERYLALILAPVFLGGAFFGDEIIRAVLGGKWAPIIFLFRVLCLSQFVISLSYFNGVIHNAMGRAHWVLYFHLIGVCLMPTAIYLVARQSFDSIALPWLIIYPSMCLGWTWITVKKLDLSISNYLRNVRSPVLASVSMIVIVKMAMTVLDRVQLLHTNYKLILGQEVIFGATIYVLYLLYFERGTLKELWSIRSA